MKRMNVALIGTKFMGKAHSNAWRQVSRFFDSGVTPVLKVACGRHRESLERFAERWGWESVETDWRETVRRPDVDIVDISVPTYLHREIAVEAARAGKHIFCEKPMALNASEAREMLDAAEKAGVVHFLNHNYRRAPAVALAKKWIDEGKLGRIYHWRACYLQSWIMDPQFPLTWHLRREAAGSGPHADLSSHLIDLARFLVGEIASVSAMTAQFVPKRPIPDEASSGAFQAGAQSGGMGDVTVDDAAFVLARFDNGALGSFESSRFAAGRKNYNCFEIYGSRGGVVFNLERMNELQYFSQEDPPDGQGYRTVLVTEPSHPYIDHWWPPGHIIGYEHTFVHAAHDFLQAIAGGGAVAPNFRDGLREMEVIDAGLESAASGKTVEVPR